MSVSFARASRIASSCPKDFDFQFFIYQNEDVYPMWMSPRRIINGLYALPESEAWNALLCVMTLLQIVIVSLNYESQVEIVEGYGLSYTTDVTYNVVFLLDIVGRIMNDVYECIHDRVRIKFFRNMWYILDFLSFSHYVSLIAFASDEIYYYIIIACYYERLHRPIGFLWTLLDYYMIGHIFFSFLKFLYFFLIIRIIYANFFVWIGSIKVTEKMYPRPPSWLQKNASKLFYRSYYFMTQLFDSIRPDTHPHTDDERLWYAMVMMTGTLGVTAISIAAMAIIISIYMRPEEVFRARFRLIMNEMKSTNVPQALRQKVDTFYRMYWLKQKAVSVTHLLPTYPPTISNAIYTDIYFEAQQKSRVLRDLSYQFLSEIARCMQTINYIPGDTIVKRNTNKSSIIYIAYGDVEMLTAEDDDTPILRFTRGSIINPCGASVKVASTLAHVGIRAATFCTAHVLKVTDLWKVAAKIGKSNGQNFILLSSFNEHLDRVKSHYKNRSHPTFKYKSTILLLKRNLMELKEAKNAEDKLLLARTNVFLELAGCYIMRNSKDTKLTQEFDVICLRPTFPCILQPMSSLLVAWQIFISLVVIFVTFMYPYIFVHLEKFPKWFEFLNAIITFIYILDIATHLSIGSKIEEGVPFTFTHTSMKQIQSMWFLVDVVSVVPMFEFIHNGQYAGMNKLLKVVKVFHTLKHFEEVWMDQATVFRFLSYGLIVILMFYMGAIVQQTLMCTVYQYCEVADLQNPPYWKRINRTDENIENRIKFGLYWSISLMTYTSLKTAALSMYANMQLTVLFLLLICSILHIMIQSTYSATIMVSETMRVQYELCIETVKEFLSKNNVDAILKQRFISYLQLCWYTDKAYSINHGKTSILYDLPPHVYQDILAMQRSKYLLSIPFMKFVNDAELKVISARARLFYTSPNEILLNTGDISNEIYVIKQGFCEVLSPVTKEVVLLITTKSHFGDVECLLRVPAFYTIRAVTHVQVFSISWKNLTKAVATPKIRDAILYAKKQEEYAHCLKRQEQFVLYQPPPPPPNRELFPLPRKHEPDIAFLLPFNRLGFLSVLSVQRMLVGYFDEKGILVYHPVSTAANYMKSAFFLDLCACFPLETYVFPRYTIRPDGKYLARFEKFRALCAFLSALVFPMYGLLEMQWGFLFYFRWALDFAAFLDIIQRMLVGYFDEKGVLVYHPASTAAYYIKGAFLVDLLGCLPLELLDNIRITVVPPGDGTKVHSHSQFLMYNRLVQMYRVPNALDFLNEYTEREDIVFIIKCIPVLIAMLMMTSSLLMLSSVILVKLFSGGYRILPKSAVPSWVHINNDAVDYDIIESPWNLFLTTMYWVTYEITTTGFNLFVPTNGNQLVYLILGMVIGSMMTTYFSVRVISIRANVHQSLACFQQNMKDILTFMKKENLSKELRRDSDREVVSYYEYMWDKTGGTDYNTVLKMCDQITLRTDAILHIYGQTFSKCPILYRCEESLLRLVGRSVRSVYFRQDMMIIERDEVASDLYFLDYGTVEVRYEDGEHVLTKLPRGSMFGNLENKQTALSTRRFVANSNVHLLKMNSMIFYSLIQDFPKIKQLLKKFRPHEETYIIGGTKTQVMAIWKEHAVSSALIVVTREGFVKYLNDHTSWIQIYLMIISLLCIFLDILNAGYEYNHTILVGVLYILDILFVLKIIFNFVLTLVAEEGSRDVSRSSRKKYLLGEFKYDIASVLPIEILSLLHEKPWTIFPQLRLNRVFRTVTLYNCLKQYRRKLSINRTCTTIAILLLWFSLLVHATTCFWYYIGNLEEEKELKSSWRHSSNGTDRCAGNQYICSMYFILTMFTHDGVGDILPRQHVEVVFVITLMIFCKMFYMIIVGEFTNILQYQSYRCFDFYSKYIQLQAFLKNNRVSKILKESTEKYSLHLWREARGLQEPAFVKAAPPCLRLNIMSAAYMEHLAGHPIFQQCEPPFLRHLVGCLQPFYYSGGMYVVREGDITNAMYFIHRGSVDKLDEDMDQKLQVFREGQSFGAFQGLNRGSSYNYSYKTIVSSQVLTLCLDKWEYLLKHFPKSKEVILADQSDASTSENASQPPQDKEKKRVYLMSRLAAGMRNSKSQLNLAKSASRVSKGRETVKSLTDTALKLRQMSKASKTSVITSPSSTARETNADNRSDDFPNKDEVEDTLRAAYSRRKSVTLITRPQVSEITTTPSEQPAESHLWPIDSRKRSESSESSPEPPTGKVDNKSKDKVQTAGPSTVKEDNKRMAQKDHDNSKSGLSGLKSQEDLVNAPSGLTTKPSTPKVTPTLLLTPISAPIPSLAPLLKLSSSIPPGMSSVQTLALSVTNVSVPPEAKASLKMKIEEQSVKKTMTAKLTIASKDTTSDSEEDQKKVTDVEKAAREARKRIRKPTVFNVNKDAIMEELKALSTSDEISDIETNPKAITLPSVQPATIEPSDRNDVEKDMLEKQSKLKDTVILPVRDDLNISSQSADQTKQETTTTTRNESNTDSNKKDLKDSMPDKTSQKEDKSITEEFEQSTLLISVSLLSPKEQVEVPTSMTDLPVASRSEFNQQALGNKKDISKVPDVEKNKVDITEIVKGVSIVETKNESQTATLSSIKEENENLLQKVDKVSPTLEKNSSIEPSPAPKTFSLADIIVEESVPKSTSGTEQKTEKMLLNDASTPEPDPNQLSSKAKSVSTPVGAPTSLLSSASQTVVMTKTAISSPTLTSNLDNVKEPIVDPMPLQITIPSPRRTTADYIPASDFMLPLPQMSNLARNLLRRSASAPILVDTSNKIPSQTLSKHLFACNCKSLSAQTQSDGSFRPRYLETIIPSLAPTAPDRIPLSALLPPRLFTASPKRSLPSTIQKTKLVEKEKPIPKPDSSTILTYKQLSLPEQVGSDVNPFGDVEYFSPKESAAEIIPAHLSRGGLKLLYDSDTGLSDNQLTEITDKKVNDEKLAKPLTSTVGKPLSNAKLTISPPISGQRDGVEPASVKPASAETTSERLAQPISAQLDLTQLASGRPDILQPAGDQLASSDPARIQSLSTQPVNAKAASAEPTTARPVYQPISAQSDRTQLETGRPDIIQPAGDPLASRVPAVDQPASTQSVSMQPASAKPVSARPESTQPARDQLETEQSDRKQLAKDQTAIPQPAKLFYQPGNTQAASTQPVSAKPKSTQQASGQPDSEQQTRDRLTSTRPDSTRPAKDQSASEQPVSVKPKSAQPIGLLPTTLTPANLQPQNASLLSPQPQSAIPSSAQPANALPTSLLPTSAQPPSALPLSASPTSVLPESVPSTSKELTKDQGSQAMKIYSKSSLEEVELRKIAYSAESSSAKVPESQYPDINIERTFLDAPEKRAITAPDYKSELDVKLTDQKTKSSRYIAESESSMSIDDPIVLTELDTVQEKSFLDKIKSMVSKSKFETEEMYGEGEKDNLLIEQDLEATNALINKYKERKRSSAGTAPIKGAGRLAAKEQSQKDKKGFEFKSRRSVRYIGPKDDAGSPDELEEDEDQDK